MISYFKYTSGEAFTLNQTDYTGFFHIEDGVPYTGKVSTETREVLTSKDTFMSKFYMDLGSFNTVYKGIDQISPYFSNVFDILNKQGLDKSLEMIDDGNLAVFKGEVLANPVVYDFEENSGFFYGLSSSSDIPTGKTDTYFTTSFSGDLEFLDDVRYGAMAVDSYSNFDYFASNGTDLYVLSGNFIDPSLPLEVVTSFNYYSVDLDNRGYVYGIYNDLLSDEMYVVNTDTVDIFSTSNFDDCKNLLLIDQITLKPTSYRDYIWNLADVKWNETEAGWNTRFTIDNENNPQFIKFGNNTRTNLEGNYLNIFNKHSSVLFNQIDLSSYDVSEVLTLDIRNTDDNILLLYKKGGELRLLYIDPALSSSEAVISDSLISSIEIVPTFTRLFDPTVIDAPNYSIKFSDIDSDMFSLSNKKEYQTRFISKPTYPAGRMEMNELFYPPNYKWNLATIKFNEFGAIWNYGNEPSNSYSNLVTSEVVKNNKMFMLHHNIGRIYALNQDPIDRFHASVPLDMVSKYKGTICSESTFGLYFNNSITNIVSDIVTLYSKSYGKFNIAEREVYSTKLSNLTDLTNNLYLNGNETFDVVSLQRIFGQIYDLQRSLIPISS